MSEYEPADPLESLLLQAARSQRAPRATRAQVRAAVGLGVGAGALTAASAAGAAASKHAIGVLTVVGVGKYLMIGAAIGMVTLGVNRYVSSPANHETPAVVSPVVSASTSPAKLAPLPVSAPTASASARPVVVPPAPPASSSPAIPALAPELALLDEARTALRRQDATAALGALDRYAREFPRGQMSAEAMVLRIEALVQSGDRASASSLAKSFEKANPRSPLVQRVRGIVGETEP